MMNEIEVDEKDRPFSIGEGFNSLKGEQGGAVLSYDDKSIVTTAASNDTKSGQATNYSLKLISQYDELNTSSSISAAASLGYGVFSGDAAFRYAHENKMTRFRNYLMVDMSVVNASTFIPIKNATPTLEAISACASATEFLRFCGDSWIEGYQKGGRLLAIVEFEDQYEEDFKSTQASVNFSIKSFGSASGSLALSDAIKSVKSTSEVKITLARLGGTNNVPGLSELANEVATFPASVNPETGHPWAIRYILRNYNAWLSLKPAGLSIADLDRASHNSTILAQRLLSAYNAQGDFEFMTNHSDLFENSSDVRNQAQEAASKVEIIIEDLVKQVDKMNEDVTTSLSAPSPLPLVPATRKQKPSVVAPPPPPPLPPTIVTLYEDSNFGGRKVDLSHSIDDLRQIGFDNITSSFVIYGTPGQYKVEFFDDGGYNGDKFSESGPFSRRELFWNDQFGKFLNWNDRIGSVRIS